MKLTPVKVCSRCKGRKRLVEFNRAYNSADTFHTWCRACTSEYNKQWRKQNPEKRAAGEKLYRERHVEQYQNYLHLRRQGITLDEYNAMVEKQGGRCAICFGEPDGIGRLHVDHDHITNKIRGLLCMSCNRGIGYLRDDVGLIEVALEYLRS